MSATTFAQHLLTGISLGGAYALIAIGYTMVYGILRLINFAHLCACCYIHYYPSNITMASAYSRL